ncbi:MAG: glycosyltransferase family 87 protein [Planctomycetota bacterium]
MSAGMGRPRFGLGSRLALVLAGLAAIELLNTARLWARPVANRVFPFGYVSQGIWSAGALFRPLDSTSTDLAPVLEAARRAFEGTGQLYADFTVYGATFNYPPTAAIELLPLGWMTAAGNSAAAMKLMDGLGRGAVLATTVIALTFCRGLPASRRQWMVLVLVLLAFYPLRWTLVCIQAQSLITLYLAVAILAYARSQGFLAGVLVGLAGCLKPYLAILVLYAAVRREWRVATGAVVSAALLIAASVEVMGMDPWWTYFGEILPRVAGGYGFWPNQTITGMAHRWAGQSTFVLGPVSRGIAIASKISLVVFALLAVWPRTLGRRSRPDDGSLREAEAVPQQTQRLIRAADLGIAILAITLASPIAWEHYFAWTVVLFAVCMAVGRIAPLPRGWFAALGCGYVFLGTYWLPVGAASSGPLSLINATGFVGAVLLLGAAWYAHRRLQRWWG